MLRELEDSDPRRVGPFRLLRRLGEGGMGVVYLGRPSDGSLVAVKLIRRALAHDPSFRDRLRREAEAARRVDGFSTAKLIEANVRSRQAYIATEYIPGPTLSEFVTRNGPLDGALLLTLAQSLSEALVAIHSAGVIHRDMSPNNVILSPDGPRVIDFGIARVENSTTITSTGMTVGTPSCMAPEQVRGLVPTSACDVWSWGCLVAYAATARFPFGEGRPEAVLYRIVHDDPDLQDVPAHLEPLVQHCLDKDPDLRPSAASRKHGTGRRRRAERPSHLDTKCGRHHLGITAR